MAGVQIAGLSTGLNWQLIINDIVAANSANINNVTARKTTVDNQATAISALSTDLTNLSHSVFDMENTSLYAGVQVTSSDPTSTWTGTASNGTPTGNYSVSVSQLATSSILNGATLTNSNLSTSSALSALNTYSPITAGTFTIDGKQFSITSTSVTLQSVLNSINSSSSSTGVAAAYDSANDVISLTTTSSTSSSVSPIILGATNDTSNILSVFKLTNASPVLNSSTAGGYSVSTAASSFTINGATVAISSGESLTDIVNSISTATQGQVVGTLSGTTGALSLTLTAASGGSINLGSDTGTFLSQMHLSGASQYAVKSSSKVGAIVPSNTLVASNITSTTGAFTVNGVTLNYDASTDTLKTILGKINNSTAGVTASYDTVGNRIVLANNLTGNTGISLSDVTGDLMSKLNLTSTSSSLSLGKNALFNVNGGSTISSASNTLDGSTFGAAGMSLTVNSLGTQTIQAATNPTNILTAINTLITAYNKLQTDIETDTLVTKDANGVATPALLSSNYEVYNWGRNIENTVFNAGSGLSGTIKSLANMGIGFTGTSRQLSIVDQSKLNQALSQKSSDVAAFFENGTIGFGAVNNVVISTMTSASTEHNSLSTQSTSIGSQITLLQAQLTTQQAQLEKQFRAMESAYSKYQTELSAINSLSGSSGSSTSSSSLNSSNVSVNGKPAGSSSSSTSSSSSSSSSSSTSSTKTA